MATNWARAGVEPALEEVMADPVVHLVMRRDGLTAKDVRAVLETVRRQHARGRERGGAEQARSVAAVRSAPSERTALFGPDGAAGGTRRSFEGA